VQDRLCSRYDHSYPYLLNRDGWLGDASARTFQFLSCSGALTKDVLENQIPRIDDNQEIILLSAGTTPNCTIFEADSEALEHFI
jgi:hypothetical protein